MFLVKGELSKEMLQQLGEEGTKVIQLDEYFAMVTEHHETDGCKIHNRPVNGYLNEKNRINNEKMWGVVDGIKKNYEAELGHISTRRILFLEDFEWERKENSNENSVWKINVAKAPKMIQELCGIDYIIKTRKFFTQYMTDGQVAAMVMAELLRIDKENGSIRKLTSESYSPFTSTFGSKWLEKGAQIAKDVSKERVELALIPTADGQQSMYKVLEITKPTEE